MAGNEPQAGRQVDQHRKNNAEDLLFCHNRIILLNLRGVAQLAAHCVWDAGVGGSSPPTPTVLNHASGSYLPMTDKKYDGVIEAVHYQEDGQVDWVRAYLRRGAAWSDRIILNRENLIKEIKSGKRIMTGQRVKFMAGTFEVSSPVKVLGSVGQEVLLTASTNANHDHLEGVPVL